MKLVTSTRNKDAIARNDKETKFATSITETQLFHTSLFIANFLKKKGPLTDLDFLLGIQKDLLCIDKDFFFSKQNY